MARPYTVKLPSRRSLAHIGIPDHRDALAIYFRWVRARYYRAHAEIGPELASSIQAAADANRTPEMPSSLFGMQLDTTRLTEDVFGAGAMFETEPIGYATEIEVCG